MKVADEAEFINRCVLEANLDREIAVVVLCVISGQWHSDPDSKRKVCASVLYDLFPTNRQRAIVVRLLREHVINWTPRSMVKLPTGAKRKGGANWASLKNPIRPSWKTIRDKGCALLHAFHARNHVRYRDRPAADIEAFRQIEEANWNRVVVKSNPTWTDQSNRIISYNDEYKRVTYSPVTNLTHRSIDIPRHDKKQVGNLITDDGRSLNRFDISNAHLTVLGSHNGFDGDAVLDVLLDYCELWSYRKNPSVNSDATRDDAKFLRDRLQNETPSSWTTVERGIYHDMLESPVNQHVRRYVQCLSYLKPKFDTHLGVQLSRWIGDNMRAIATPLHLAGEVVITIADEILTTATDVDVMKPMVPLSPALIGPGNANALNYRALVMAVEHLYQKPTPMMLLSRVMPPSSSPLSPYHPPPPCIVGNADPPSGSPATSERSTQQLIDEIRDLSNEIKTREELVASVSWAIENFNQEHGTSYTSDEIIVGVKGRPRPKVLMAWLKRLGLMYQVERVRRLLPPSLRGDWMYGPLPINAADLPQYRIFKGKRIDLSHPLQQSALALVESKNQCEQEHGQPGSAIRQQLFGAVGRLGCPAIS